MCLEQRERNGYKNVKQSTLAEYKVPLVQLMLEKGFCNKNNYGNPSAYLHVSNKINVKNSSLEKCVSDYIKDRKNDILIFFNELSKISDESIISDELLRRLDSVLKNNTRTIGINRTEYKTKYSELETKCNHAMGKIDKGEVAVEQAIDIKDTLNNFIKYLRERLCAQEVCDDVKVYEYEEDKFYCNGSDIFEEIVLLIKQYKGNACGFTEGQFKYIADRMITFIEDKVLERHKNRQENKDISCEIMLCEFTDLLDGSIENYEREANILALKRLYNDYLNEYCEDCLNLNYKNHCDTNCKLQQPEYIRSTLEQDEFVKYCYNLNPECDKKISDRECLSFLLNKDGMMESVFRSIKAGEEDKFVGKLDKIHVNVKNQNKTAFLTAISSQKAFRIVKNIIKSMQVHPNLIETIFEADQLVTTRLNADSSAWDSSCIKVRLSDLTDTGTEVREINDDEHSIYIAKKPEFIGVDDFIKSMERKI